MSRIYHRPRSNRKKEVWERDRWICYYCKEDMRRMNELLPGYATVEHLQKLSLGGSNSLDNLVACCRSCNLNRS